VSAQRRCLPMMADGAQAPFKNPTSQFSAHVIIST
jgi:hypothetical protein